MINTRIAPSPTGKIHLGTLRTAYFNWLIARATGGKFILRIDDTDKKRSSKKNVRYIKKVFKYFGLHWDEMVKQSKRTKRYKELAEELVRRGYAFIEKKAIILKTESKKYTNTGLLDAFFPKEWKDEIVGKIKVTKQDLADLKEGIVLIKGDGSPTYMFASIVDDVDFNIGNIVRGVDHFKNSPKQLYIYNMLWLIRALPKRNIIFSHIGLIVNKKKKLSKRDRLFSLDTYMKRNVPKEAVLNFILRLGWSPKEDNKENSIIPMNKALAMFLRNGNLRNSPAEFDEKKLQWYIKKYTIKKAKSRFSAFCSNTMLKVKQIKKLIVGWFN